MPPRSGGGRTFLGVEENIRDDVFLIWTSGVCEVPVAA